MAPFLSSLALLLLPSLISAHPLDGKGNHPQEVITTPELSINGVPYSTRAYWMRRANQALSDLDSPCQFGAFGTAIVNHTTTNGLGDLVCIGINENSKTGNPSMHGEIAAISNCTKVLTDPEGPYNLTTSQAQAAFTQLTLYTNAESCPMCAAAIRWAGFKEYVYGTSIATLIEQGWGQIRISSQEVFQQSYDLPNPSRLIAEVIANETDPYFLWQYNPAYPCPAGCERPGPGETCKRK
ncbi:hypothetical protein AJ80_01622 [Polytolypa hystricis UAMH7299]|uniref:CMP/dCMP-type deaminase domain-containing protein n=1 Tax=Polytolypa hystricis (strain UAMH7299) TaxID=1447883 RepID=A0A2B7YYB7_POLH7|nr:hypothetical protein AJ80_01622 [Polytolypa hystricis UAMH7299]